MLRREFIAVLGGAVAARPLAGHAQKSLPRIGWLVFGDAKLGPIDQSLKDALAQAGLVDGRNIEIVFRYANGTSDRLAELSAELIAQKPNLLLAVGGPVVMPLFEAVKAAYPSLVALARVLCGRESRCLLLGQVRISPGLRFSRMKWQPSG
jgi:putative ABC transport system substrate-binding protein